MDKYYMILCAIYFIVWAIGINDTYIRIKAVFVVLTTICFIISMFL